METKEGLETEKKVEEIIIPPPPEPKPPTADTLQKQIDELKAKYEQADKGLRSAQATLTQKDRLLKDKEDVHEKLDKLEMMIKVLATARAQEVEDDLDTVAKERKPNIDKAFEELEQKQKAKRHQEQVQETILGIQKRVEALGLTEDDERYLEIYKLATSAIPVDLKIADIKLKKLEKEKEITPVDTKPTDDREKEIADLKKQVEKLQKQVSGALDSETGLPSGASVNEEQIRKNFRENSTNPAARKAYLDLMAKKRG